MNKKITYLVFGFLLLTFRLFFNFKFDLIPGINGGYYPLQVRKLIETGQLGFSDVPLYFYVNAAVVKCVLLIKTFEINPLILTTSKLIDSLSLPLLVVPFYLIQKRFGSMKLPSYFGVGLIGFATLSFSPLMLTSDLQKNAFAIPLLLFFIYYLLSFYKGRSKKNLILTAVFMLLVGLTHFGAFAISLLILILSSIFFFRKQAILFSLGIFIVAVGFVFLFDPHRSDRLLYVLAVIFEKPMILQGPLTPPELINFIFSYFLIGLGIYIFIRRKNQLTPFRRKVYASLLGVVFVLSFPLIDMEYSKRFGLFLFIPQLLILLFSFDALSQTLKKIMATWLVLISLVSVFLVSGQIKPPAISKEAFLDLENLKLHISYPDQTLIIARHGLEWWTAWALKTKVGQDKSLDKTTSINVSKVISLVQLEGVNSMNPREIFPFHEPHFHTQQKPFYRSRFFEATELTKEDLENIEPGAWKN